MLCEFNAHARYVSVLSGRTSNNGREVGRPIRTIASDRVYVMCVHPNPRAATSCVEDPGESTALFQIR